MSTMITPFGPRQRSAFDRASKEGGLSLAGLSLRSEGAVNSTNNTGRSRLRETVMKQRGDYVGDPTFIRAHQLGCLC
jgi:hypothetical protein